MNKERLLQRFLQYVTCASETYQEREFCIMMEEELTSLGLHWERQEIGETVSYTHLRAHETGRNLVCRLLLEKKKSKTKKKKQYKSIKRQYILRRLLYTT